MAALQRGHKMPKLMTQDDFALCLDCPAYMRLVELVSDLSDEERIDLLALGMARRRAAQRRLATEPRTRRRDDRRGRSPLRGGLWPALAGRIYTPDRPAAGHRTTDARRRTITWSPPAKCCRPGGVHPAGLITVVRMQWFGSEALELTHSDAGRACRAWRATASRRRSRSVPPPARRGFTPPVTPLAWRISRFHRAQAPPEPGRGAVVVGLSYGHHSWPRRQTLHLVSLRHSRQHPPRDNTSTDGPRLEPVSRTPLTQQYSGPCDNHGM